ncbi:MAG TPA: hypothetical protein VK509_02845 [Polyangiales bacterium]|nr:hypothetical protein [Polyangiales bacterium]
MASCCTLLAHAVIVPTEASAEPPAEVVRIDAVLPETFGAGAILSITGAGLREGDRFRLGQSALEVVELQAPSAKLRVPAAAKRGGAITVQRGARTVASFSALHFIPAPLLLAALPRSASPGQRVTVRGKNLDTVTELRVGDSAIELAAKTAGSLSFVVPDGLQSGALAVRSPGGEASLRQPFEIYQPPVVTKVKPDRFGAGATLRVEGTGLSEQLAIKLGATTITGVKKTKRGLELQLPATLKKGGPLLLRAAGRPPVRFDALVFVPAPRLISAKPLSAKPGDTVQLRGTGLDAIDELRVGDQVIEPSARSASQLAFVVGPSLASGVIEVRGAGGTAALRTPLVVVGAAKLADPAKTAEEAKAAEAAKQPEGSGEPVYHYGDDELPGLLTGAIGGYTLSQIQRDIEQSSARYASPAGSAASHVGSVSRKATRALSAAALALTVELARMTVAQRGSCQAMAKGKNQAKDNAQAGELLARATQQAQKLLREGLVALWKGMPDTAWTDPKPAAELALAEVDDRLALVIGGSEALQLECADRVHGRDRLVARATDTADAGLARDYEALVEGELTRLRDSAASPDEGKQRVQQALSVFSSRRREHWQRRLAGLSQRVQDSAIVTGKGARTGKTATKVGK